MDSRKNTEMEILRAAKKIFIQHGYAGARMQAIADEAKINKAMLHYYYRSKDALFEKIMDGAVDLMSKQLTNALSGDAPVMEKVEKMVSNYTDTIIKNPYIPIFILNEIARNQMNFQNKLLQKLEQNNIFQNFLLQVLEEQQKGILRSIPVPHFMITIMSLIVFPHIAKPVFLKIFEVTDTAYMHMMEERKQLVMDFLEKSFVP
ncbi:TetR/AcrR family transcriptional regulator [Muricauda sp. SCSIO 64092]|uniref:TetR/AcrR family transcriptional regulator n=1 Tax=Allomuricauda sp. SCSIO 64092 TaxID=2908842 RepID=UPI001FF1C353|nr:TetR/AcrR family transcriptional regulator [Muricauda sp. SCSIO 64092]UOY08356.1 TetR/AcrR family transcriptional regulator [Muricauda sp. SCSIO 64092]